ncbi:hypothetical protein [Mesorhizobium sp.]|uniref:hypothetical protein n=1 Tax=Mesorhizobium sp. TaxID=1871066 RepID=UPI000FE9A468|nr:hypothetical protein [Mesorhizobium sp.]RWA69379.1 MAG: hypothetical protein EOQ29_17570 [Mesorhizobium sp.]
MPKPAAGAQLSFIQKGRWLEPKFDAIIRPADVPGEFWSGRNNPSNEPVGQSGYVPNHLI